MWQCLGEPHLLISLPRWRIFTLTTLPSLNNMRGKAWAVDNLGNVVISGLGFNVCSPASHSADTVFGIVYSCRQDRAATDTEVPPWRLMQFSSLDLVKWPTLLRSYIIEENSHYLYEEISLQEHCWPLQPGPIALPSHGLLMNPGYELGAIAIEIWGNEHTTNGGEDAANVHISTDA